MTSELISKYLFAKTIVIDEGYSNEITWQLNVQFDDLDESTFLKEIAWVILTSGMKEKIIRIHFLNLSKCFYNWESAEIIVANENKCFNEAIKYFNNKLKISAIIYAAHKIGEAGFNQIKENYDFDSNTCNKYIEEMKNLTKMNVSGRIKLELECVEASKEVSKLFVPALSAVRKDMDILFDEGSFKKNLEKSWKEGQESIIKF